MFTFYRENTPKHIYFQNWGALLIVMGFVFSFSAGALGAFPPGHLNTDAFLYGLAIIGAVAGLLFYNLWGRSERWDFRLLLYTLVMASFSWFLLSSFALPATLRYLPFSESYFELALFVVSGFSTTWILLHTFKENREWHYTP